jgi:hypothetical protein
MSATLCDSYIFFLSLCLQKTLVFVNGIKILVFLVELRFVFCEVGGEFLNIVEIFFRLRKTDTYITLSHAVLVNVVIVE